VKLFQKTSIKHKQTLIVMLTSGVALVLACLAFGSYEVMTFRTVMVENLSALADIIGNNSAAALDFSDPKSAKETLSALQAQPHIIAGCIYTAKGDVFAVYVRSGEPTSFVPPIVRQGSQEFDNDSLRLFRPIARGGESLGTVYVVSDLNALYSRLDRYAFIAAGVFIASAFVAFLISQQLQKMISGPILSLVQTARAVTVEKNYAVRVVKTSDDELGTLIDAFNEMLKQIQERDSALQHSHVELENRVTERTKEVVNSLSLIRATLESTTDGILVTNGDGAVTSFNEKFVEMWGISRALAESDEGKKMLEEVSPLLVIPEEFLSMLKATVANPNLESFDLLEFKDGRLFERYSKPQMVEEDCVGRVWSFRDVTDRKRAEERLERLSNEYKAVLNSLGEGVHWLGGDGRIKFENQMAARLLGYELSELVGQPAHATMHHSRRDGTPYPVSESPIYATLNDGLIRHVKNEVFWRKDGTSFPVDYISTPIHDENGRHAGTVVIFTDVTEIRRAEAELEEMHKQLLDTSRQAGMAEVATSVLHNVGNVLNSINVSSTLASDRVRTSKVVSLSKVVAMFREHAEDLGKFLKDDPRGRQIPAYLGQLSDHLLTEQKAVLEELALLHRNVEHVKDIVAMQQSYARISGIIETVKITDLVEDALSLNMGALLRHGVEVIREFETLPAMDVEKHKILQILVNLVRNAKYACDESLRSNKLITLKVSKSNDMVIITVEDNGIGIPPENLVRIFSHGFTTRKEGHGFGLHSAVLAAMEMGGSLRVRSDGLDKGATFTLELPYKPHLQPSEL
jgi:PAS domain S-box-containing protein